MPSVELDDEITLMSPVTSAFFLVNALSLFYKKHALPVACQYTYIYIYYITVYIHVDACSVSVYVYIYIYIISLCTYTKDNFYLLSNS